MACGAWLCFVCVRRPVLLSVCISLGVTNSKGGSDEERKAQQATGSTMQKAKHQGYRHHTSNHTTQHLHKQAASRQHQETHPVQQSPQNADARKRRRHDKQATQTAKQPSPQHPPPVALNSQHHSKVQHALHTCRLQHHHPQAKACNSDAKPRGANAPWATNTFQLHTHPKPPAFTE
jgi:hypothetical protein